MAKNAFPGRRDIDEAKNIHGGSFRRAWPDSEDQALSRSVRAILNKPKGLRNILTSIKAEPQHIVFSP